MGRGRLLAEKFGIVDALRSEGKPRDVNANPYAGLNGDVFPKRARGISIFPLCPLWTLL